MSPSHSFFPNIELSRIVFFCFGNRDRADDAFGLMVAEKLAEISPKSVFSEEVEDISVFLVDIISKDVYDAVVIIDAIDYGAKPGSLLVTADISDYIRPLTSHSIPLPQIKELVEIQKKEFLFIGAQAKSVEFMQSPSNEIKRAVKEVIALIS
ncbi:MAG: hydrogenase maturation protease [Candidatus Heimdallarchaeota archaeon]|nr:hydrogenase maturation protease [Candidatus Heimdallarchaeota archaeon]MCK5143631.1 hydrogenase maturation protease [Candidatus Heimdallarchaeota archaeon]